MYAHCCTTDKKIAYIQLECEFLCLDPLFTLNAIKQLSKYKLYWARYLSVNNFRCKAWGVLLYLGERESVRNNLTKTINTTERFEWVYTVCVWCGVWNRATTSTSESVVGWAWHQFTDVVEMTMVRNRLVLFYFWRKFRQVVVDIFWVILRRLLCNEKMSARAKGLT